MINPIYITFFKSPVGEIILGDYNSKICLCDWRYRKQREQIDKRIINHLKATYVELRTDAHEQVIAQLKEYFYNSRTSFDLPLLLLGTQFQKSVWKLLQIIPFGETTSYKNLSIKLKNEGAVRAVAAANGANSISIIIPCHRVIGADGALVGYAGGLQAKKELLLIEGVQLPKEQLKLF